MTVNKCGERLEDLRTLLKIYNDLYNDPYRSLYKDKLLGSMKKHTNDEILRLEELMYNEELEDSYDQNTGEVNGN